MDRTTIADKARQLETKEQLLQLLNRAKADDFESAGGVGEFYPFSMKSLNYYCNPNHTRGRFKQFTIPKKSGGERQITAPASRSYMELLRYVNEIFKALYTPSKYANGFAEGRSVVTNAEIHKGQNYILNLDLKDFFPSIDQARVWKRLQLEPLSLKPPIASLLAGLCAMKVREEDRVRYVLPQGAPTSPILTNMICDTLDRRLAGVAHRFGLRYSRYADDITFSSLHNVYQPEGEFLKEVRRIIEDQGFRINEAKTRLQKRGAHQEVTGIVVSDKLNVSRRYVRSLRNLLYIWDRYGYDDAQRRFASRYKAEKGHLKSDVPDMISVLYGKLVYLRMVKGEDDSVYLRLWKKFDHLRRKHLGLSRNTSVGGTTFATTTEVLEFERQHNTTIVILPDPSRGEMKTGAESAGDDTGTIAQSRRAYFTLRGEKQRAIVSRYLSSEEEKMKELLSISYCYDPAGHPFWLIHKTETSSSLPQSETEDSVDVDKLNRELVRLLLESHER